jgi:uncharacterized protein (TIGR03437 family)
VERGLSALAVWHKRHHRQPDGVSVVITISIRGVRITPDFVGLSSAGLYQINLTIPPGLSTGDLPLQAIVAGATTQSGVVISLQ